VGVRDACVVFGVPRVTSALKSAPPGLRSPPVAEQEDWRPPTDVHTMYVH
jgi:hypothetical protein